VTTAYANPEGAERKVTLSMPTQPRHGLHTAYVTLTWSHWDDSVVLRHFTRPSRRQAWLAAERFCRAFDPDDWGKRPSLL
jgi:hypothetical protein